MWKLFSHDQASILQASDGERQEAIEHMVRATTLRQGYYLLLMLSVAIVTAGILVENPPIVIGGMIVAPVLTPILLLAVSAVSRSFRGARHALAILAITVVLTLVLAAGLTWTFSHVIGAPTLVPSPIHPLVYLLVALCSGAIASLAWVKREWAPTIAGIAISVSLLPPLCSAGIGFALGSIPAMQSGLTVFATNALGILGAAIATFILLGFARFGRVTEQTLRNEQNAAT